MNTYARAARLKDRAAGLATGPSRQTRLGGQPALEWDLTMAAQPSFHGLQVVAVENDVGWTVQLDDSSSAFPAHVDPFRAMLASWHFR